ncbi:aminotransferase class I/II-fold pyridoxal phosphate-dependent enzyme [bacterium]|nr:MAG: aminotransferase class I/II-fold pyridoxal phosphate-dependent enzyme [bacterium]
MIDKLLCRYKHTILEALQIINDNGKGVVFVLDKECRLCGVLTDGDIRRLLLSGHHLYEKVSTILSGKFSYARDNENYEALLAKVNDAVKIVPIVNDQMKVVDYFQYREDVHIPVAYPDLSGNELKYLTHAFLSTWISSRGIYIDIFEKGFSKFCNCQYGVATSNGTVALHLALLALGIGKGDEVIVPDLTFAATINAVIHAQAKPVIVDIEKESWCIDPMMVKKAITPRTKAIIPVHLYGQPCDMGAIMWIAKKHRLHVIEDCAEAHGATFDGKKVGSFGDIGCFSFFANKIITTGEGGMCVTNSAVLKDKMKLLRDHGMSQDRKYWHEIIGYNYRMTNLQASIGVAQLERIKDILKKREEIEAEYRAHLSDFPMLEFQRNDIPKRKKIVWLVSVLFKDSKRDLYIKKFLKKSIEVRPFFYSLSSMDLYKKYARPCPVSKYVASQGINFPTVSQKRFDQMFRDIRSILKNT